LGAAIQEIIAFKKRASYNPNRITKKNENPKPPGGHLECCGTRGIKEHPGRTRGVRFVLGRLHCRMTKTYGSCSSKVAERAIEDKRNMREPDEQLEIVISLPPSRVGRLFVT